MLVPRQRAVRRTTGRLARHRTRHLRPISGRTVADCCHTSVSSSRQALTATRQQASEALRLASGQEAPALQRPRAARGDPHGYRKGQRVPGAARTRAVAAAFSGRDPATSRRGHGATHPTCRLQVLAGVLRPLSHHPRPHRPLLVYHRTLERIEERTAELSRHVKKALMVDEKTRRPVRHHVTPAPEGR